MGYFLYMAIFPLWKKIDNDDVFIIGKINFNKTPS